MIDYFNMLNGSINIAFLFSTIFASINSLNASS